MPEDYSAFNTEMNLFYDKKVAICHEWIDNIGGGEKVRVSV